LQLESADIENNRIKVLGNVLPPMPEVVDQQTVRPNRPTGAELQKRAMSAGKCLELIDITNVRKLFIALVSVMPPIIDVSLRLPARITFTSGVNQADFSSIALSYLP
jgi:hypothetical protein